MKQLIENKEKIEAVVDMYWKLIVMEVGDEQAREAVPDEPLLEVEQQSPKVPKFNLRKLIDHSHQRILSGQASQGEQEDRSNSLISSPSIRKQDKLRRSSHAQAKDIQSSVQADNDHQSCLSHKISFRLNQVDLDRKATFDINNLINKLQRDNTQQLIIEERQQENMIRESAATSLQKLDYLSLNYQEQWLKQMFPQQLSAHLRCNSQIHAYNLHCSTSYQGLSPSANIIQKAELLLSDPYLQERLKVLREKQEHLNEMMNSQNIGSPGQPIYRGHQIEMSEKRRTAEIARNTDVPTMVLDEDPEDDQEVEQQDKVEERVQNRGRLNDMLRREEEQEDSNRRSVLKMNTTHIDTSYSYRMHNESSRMIVKDEGDEFRIRKK